MTQFLSLTFTGGKHRVLTRHWSPPARSIPRGEGLRTPKVSGLTPLGGAPALSKKVSACSGSGVLGREHGEVKTPVHPEALAVMSPSFPATRPRAQPHCDHFVLLSFPPIPCISLAHGKAPFTWKISAGATRVPSAPGAARGHVTQAVQIDFAKLGVKLTMRTMEFFHFFSVTVAWNSLIVLHGQRLAKKLHSIFNVSA